MIRQQTEISFHVHLKEQFLYKKPWRPKGLFQFDIIIQFFPINLNTYIMSLRQLATLDVRF